MGKSPSVHQTTARPPTPTTTQKLNKSEMRAQKPQMHDASILGRRTAEASTLAKRARVKKPNVTFFPLRLKREAGPFEPSCNRNCLVERISAEAVQ